jgi:hypothetical protein
MRWLRDCLTQARAQFASAAPTVVVPSSACRRIKAICCSLNRDFCLEKSSAGPGAGKLEFSSTARWRLEVRRDWTGRMSMVTVTSERNDLLGVPDREGRGGQGAARMDSSHLQGMGCLRGSQS